ncbi:MAG TPA: iron chelate uptake ABC transporter family permease subunit [Methylomirabilota bacterium]|nr:iron chelate uptake ABC transporter family permease subunit [Methylomirabilota bacterium]
MGVAARAAPPPDLAAARPLGRRAPVRRPLVLVAGAGALLLMVVVVGTALGAVAVPLDQTAAILGRRLLGLPFAVTWPASAETIVLELRLPRVLTAMVVGGGLAVTGAALQGLLRNPLADPYVLGTSSGAALGAAIGILIPFRVLFLDFGLVHVLAFAGALAAVLTVERLSRRGTLASLTGLLLTGYAVSSLLAAGLALVMYASGQSLRQIFFFLLGSFDGSTWLRLAGAAPIVLVGVLLIALRARALNALLLGEDGAAHLGLEVGRERTILLVLASLVTAASVAVSGLIGFVGLVVPHAVRLLVGPNARAVVPASLVMGAAFLGLADLVSRLAGEIPVGVVTAIVGAPFFLYLLGRARTGYEL